MHGLALIFAGTQLTKKKPLQSKSTAAGLSPFGQSGAEVLVTVLLSCFGEFLGLISPASLAHQPCKVISPLSSPLPFYFSSYFHLFTLRNQIFSPSPSE